jgi:hypothetical protein
LCVDTAFLFTQQEIKVYYPAVLFPTHLDINDIFVELHDGPAKVCGNGTALERYPLRPRKLNLHINTTTIMISESPAILNAVENQHLVHLQMRDAKNTQCLMGPSLAGEFSNSVMLKHTIKTIPSDDPSTAASELENPFFSQREVQVAFLVLAGLVLLVGVIYITVRFQVAKKSKSAPRSNERENQHRGQAMTMHEPLGLYQINSNLQHSSLGEVAIPNLHSDASSVSSEEDLPLSEFVRRREFMESSPVEPEVAFLASDSGSIRSFASGDSGSFRVRPISQSVDSVHLSL